MPGITVQKYVDYIKKKLGGRFVRIETEIDLPNIVEISLDELKEYLTLSKFVTVPYANRIDLSNYKVKSIIQVYRTQAAGAVSNTAGSTDAFLLAAGMVNNGAYDLNGYMSLLQARRLKNTIQTDLDYRYDNPYLYIIQNAQACSMITIEYTPDVESVEEIDDEWWIGKLRKLCLANAKIELGRVRTKYKLANSLYENDGSTILQEGNQEHDALMQFLEENYDIILPIGS